MVTTASTILHRLYKLKGFTNQFPNLSLSPSSDPVTHLWDILATGTPLCYIFDQLPEDEDFMKINHYSLTEGPYEPNSDRAMKRAIAIFALQVRAKPVLDKIPGCEIFTVADLWDRQSTAGFVKVLNTVNAILDYLPPEAFKDGYPSPDAFTNNFDISDLNNSLRKSLIQNLLSTEQKYIQDLEIVEEYFLTLSNFKNINQDLPNLLFPSLNQLLSFQRKFLMHLKITSRQPFQEQRWGQQLLQTEDGFSVYDSYCANYINTSDLILAHEQNLAPLNHIINAQTELANFLFKPIERICQYPILIEPLVKTFSPETYKYYEEFASGLDATKRIVERINEAQRLGQNRRAFKNLLDRVTNWKGHLPPKFGELVLYDLALITRSKIDRPYSIFLFEKIVILCKEVAPDHTKKHSKQKYAMPSDEDAAAMLQQNTPLQLKGRIYIVHIISATYHTGRLKKSSYPLNITWAEGDSQETFIMQCRNEQQRSRWHEAIRRLIRETGPEIVGNPSSHSVVRRLVPPERRHAINYNFGPNVAAVALPGIVDRSESSPTPSNNIEQLHTDSDSDDLEAYSPVSFPSSGRQTPVDRRRLLRSRSLSPRPTFINDYGNESPVPFLRRAKSTSTLPQLPVEWAVILPEDPTDEHISPPIRSSDFSSLNHSRFSGQAPFSVNDATGVENNPIHFSSTVKVKVHFQSRIFIMAVPRTIEFDELQGEIMRKIQLWDPKRAEMGSQLRVRYQDEDGDMISLASADDLQIALSEFEGQVRLYVS